MAPEVCVRVSPARIDVGAETAALSGDGRAGALVSFVGWCRDEEGRLRALELEHYPGMAEAELRRLGALAAERFALLRVALAHRHGLILPGEEIVFVGCTAPHRGAAFEGAAFLMDYLKTDAPFWKREHPVDGSPGGWVDAKASDTRATNRWHRL